eukprot:m.67473 g.67473  ORF g.67473 m.67473 type:complete len:304 (+) comp12163_c0_seq5:77-988(+)
MARCTLLSASLALVVSMGLLLLSDVNALCNMTADPSGYTRTGSDYTWLAMPQDATIEDCMLQCCVDARCQAFSFNHGAKVCTQAPSNATVCCALKDATPPAVPSSWNKSEVVTGAKEMAPAGIPKLTDPRLLDYLDMGLTQFMHFSVTTFGNIEHDCVNGKCLPASMFNPTQMGPDKNGITATDQWVLTAKAMGAGEICLTAHHEGGFCLFETKFSNYSVMQSPYKQDIVSDFVASCRKHGIRPCFYMGPNANGYFTQYAFGIMWSARCSTTHPKSFTMHKWECLQKCSPTTVLLVVCGGITT